MQIRFEGNLKSHEKLYNEVKQRNKPSKYIKILKELIEIEKK